MLIGTLDVSDLSLDFVVTVTFQIPNICFKYIPPLILFSCMQISSDQSSDKDLVRVLILQTLKTVLIIQLVSENPKIRLTLKKRLKL